MKKYILVIQGCGRLRDTNGSPQIVKTGHLERAYTFGRDLFSTEAETP